MDDDEQLGQEMLRSIRQYALNMRDDAPMLEALMNLLNNDDKEVTQDDTN